MIWSVAWKNIWRNKVRSLVIILAISLGLLGGIFSSAVMKGMGDQRVKEAISRETSHIQIHNPAYIEDNDIRFIIHRQDALHLTKTLDTMPQIAAWSPRIKFESMANNANASAGVMVYGVIPEKEVLVSEIPATICDSCGAYFDPKKPYSAIVGNAFAKKLRLRLNSKFVLSFQDIDGTLTGAAFRVSGIYRTSNSAFDEMNIFVNKADIGPLLAIPPDEFHEAAIRLKDFRQVQIIQEKLTRLFPGLSIRNWKQIDPILGLLTDLMNTWVYLFMLIILLALGFAIVNTMMMVILERIREFGVLNAIGMNKPKVFLKICIK
jgi:putative ABC transport system permease protein